MDHDVSGRQTYAWGVTAAVTTNSGAGGGPDGPEGEIGAGPDSGGVRMTKSAVDALRALDHADGAAVAKAIAAIGVAEGRPAIAGSNGAQYFAMVPDDARAPVVLYREAPGGYLVTSLVDRAAYQTFETADQPGFLQSGPFKAAVGAVAAAALGVILGSRAGRSNPGSLFGLRAQGDGAG